MEQQKAIQKGSIVAAEWRSTTQREKVFPAWKAQGTDPE